MREDFSQFLPLYPAALHILLALASEDRHGYGIMREVARPAAQRLGFAYVDEEIILRAAAEGGVEPTRVASIEERSSFIDRTLQRVAATPDPGAFTSSRMSAWSRDCRSCAA